MTSCSFASPFGHVFAWYIGDDDVCHGHSRNGHQVEMVAICCSLITSPSISPTETPSEGPSVSPTTRKQSERMVTETLTKKNKKDSTKQDQSEDSSSNDNNSESETLVIVITVLGVLALLLFIGFIGCFARKRKLSARKETIASNYLFAVPVPGTPDKEEKCDGPVIKLSNTMALEMPSAKRRLSSTDEVFDEVPGAALNAEETTDCGETPGDDEDNKPSPNKANEDKASSDSQSDDDDVWGEGSRNDQNLLMNTVGSTGAGGQTADAQTVDAKHIADEEHHQFYEWLSDVAECMQYFNLFGLAGYDNLNLIQEIQTGQELQKIGIDDIDHQNKLLEAIEKLKESTNMI